MALNESSLVIDKSCHCVCQKLRNDDWRSNGSLALEEWLLLHLIYMIVSNAIFEVVWVQPDSKYSYSAMFISERTTKCLWRKQRALVQTVGRP